MPAQAARSARASPAIECAHNLSRSLGLSLSVCFRHPRATRGIHLTGECEARVRDISPTYSRRAVRRPFPLLRPYNTDVPTSASRVDADLDADPVQVRSGIRDDTTGTNDALSRNIARIWRTGARGVRALSGLHA